MHRVASIPRVALARCWPFWKVATCTWSGAIQQRYLSTSPRKRKQDKDIFEKTAVYHEEVEVTIDSITESGLGAAVHGGRNILIPSVLIGETVRAQLYNCEGENYNADLLEVISPGAARVQPKCSYFGQCSGCQYQHMDITEQRRLKAAQVQELFLKTGGFPNIDLLLQPVLGTDNIYHYRTKLTPRYLLSEKGEAAQKIGFQKVGRRDILDVDYCAIATPLVNAGLEEVRGRTIQRKKFNQGSLILRESVDGAVALDYKTVVGQAVGALTFHFKAGSFFQINKFAVPALVDYVLQQAVGHGCNRLIDTFCGAGLFSICAAGSFDRVLGVEIDADSVEWAIRNAHVNGIRNADFIAADSINIFGNIDKKYAENSVVIIDPPRVGCRDSFLEKLIEFKPKKIVYISCNPATQARDAFLIVNNGYKMSALTPVDLFPQTKHTESIATFILADEKE